MGYVVSGLLSFSACEVMVFPAYQEFALSFEVEWVNDMRRDLFWSGRLEFLPGILFRVLGNGIQRSCLCLVAFWWWSIVFMVW